MTFFSWWSDDIDTIEWTQLESVTSYYGIYQDYNNSKLFADDTFLFSENCDAEIANILCNDLRKIRKWAEQWKMVF